MSNANLISWILDAQTIIENSTPETREAPKPKATIPAVTLDAILADEAARAAAYVATPAPTPAPVAPVAPVIPDLVCVNTLTAPRPVATAMVAVTGDTWPVRESLRALGARWNGSSKTWYVPADRAREAQALVASVQRGRSARPQARRAPAPASVAFVPVYGDTYQVRGDIKALGGRWDAVARRWTVPASRAAEVNDLPGVFVAEQTAPDRSDSGCGIGPFVRGICQCCGRRERASRACV